MTMKKTITTLVFCVCVFITNAQWATFEPIITPLPGQSSTVNSEPSQISRTTGYVLTESGFVDKKVQLKVQITTRGKKEICKIVAYYLTTGFMGDGWTTVSEPAYEINSTVTSSRMEEVAYKNFTYYVHLNGNKIWFNP